MRNGESDVTTSFDPAPAARLLVDASRAGTQIAGLADAMRPATLDQGYDVQDRFVALDGDPVAGWKLGQGSPKGLRAARLERPLVGRVLRSRCHQAGGEIAVGRNGAVTVEIEIAFRLAADVAPTSPSRPTRELVAATLLASEVILSRYADRKVVGLPSYLAENVGFEALVLGPEIDAEEIAAISSCVTVDCNGRRVAGAQTGEDAIDPYQALDYLIAHARHRGLTLQRGEIVTTGTISNPFDVGGPHARVVAHAGRHVLEFDLRWP